MIDSDSLMILVLLVVVILLLLAPPGTGNAVARTGTDTLTKVDAVVRGSSPGHVKIRRSLS